MCVVEGGSIYSDTPSPSKSSKFKILPSPLIFYEEGYNISFLIPGFSFLSKTKDKVIHKHSIDELINIQVTVCLPISPSDRGGTFSSWFSRISK